MAGGVRKRAEDEAVGDETTAELDLTGAEDEAAGEETTAELDLAGAEEATEEAALDLAGAEDEAAGDETTAELDLAGADDATDEAALDLTGADETVDEAGALDLAGELEAAEEAGELDLAGADEATDEAAEEAAELDLAGADEAADETAELDLTPADEDAAGVNEIRSSIVPTLMRYLDTDSLLCWAPEPAADPPGYEAHEKRTESLRSIQERTALPIIAYLTEKVWPGIEIVPDSDASTIMPTPQPQMTKDVIRGWVSSLPPFELAGLERAVLASKSLLIGTRLVVEWSEEFRDLQKQGNPSRFGIEEAAHASTIEVRWQTGMWGEVEDTHDVDREDVRRQLGSAILVVSGAK